jgi:hypothetical protein
LAIDEVYASRAGDVAEGFALKAEGATEKPLLPWAAISAFI